MESWIVVFLVTIGYLGLSLVVGLASGRRASGSTEGYVAGDGASTAPSPPSTSSRRSG